MKKMIQEKRGFFLRSIAALSFIAAIIGYILEYVFEIRGCFLCHTERVILILCGFFTLLSAWYSYNAIKILSYFSWLAGSLISFYHLGVQWKIFQTPAFCKAIQVKGSTLEAQLDHFLSHPVVSCDKITLSFLGLPFSLYLGLFFAVYGIAYWIIQKDAS